MTKIEFLEELRFRLAGLSTEERDAALRYYEEYFDDFDVKDEEAAVQKLGSPASVAETILDGLSGNTVPEAFSPPKVPKRNTLPLWGLIVLALFAISIIIPLFAATGSVLATFILVIFIFAFALVLLVFSIFIAGIALIGAGISMAFQTLAQGLFLIGCGLVAIGLGFALFIPATWATFNTGKKAVRKFTDFFHRLFGRRTKNEKID